MPTLVTGAAGFIGFHLSRRLLARGDEVVGVDNLNPYYDVGLKEARLACLRTAPRFTFHRLDIADREAVARLFRDARPRIVAHLAAQPGVRDSLEHPHAYVDANLVGFVNVLEGCRHAAVDHLLFASSSSVYGANAKLPSSTDDRTDHPVSLYGATKKANEVLAHAYSHLYRVPTTGLRFFTVYGPWGRPDMAYFRFTEAILAGRPIDLYNDGAMERDFAYVDDIVEATVRLLDRPPAPDPYRIYNLGNGEPVALTRFIAVLEECLGRTAITNPLPMQPGDVPITYADVEDLAEAIAWRPSTPIAVGLSYFVDWYRGYYRGR